MEAVATAITTFCTSAASVVGTVMVAALGAGLVIVGGVFVYKGARRMLGK